MTWAFSHSATPARVGGPGQAVHELADVDACAERIDHAAGVEVAADLAVDVLLVDDGHRVVGQLGEGLLGLAHLADLLGVHGQGQLAGALEVAVDGVLFHELLDGVDGAVVLREHLERLVPPVPLDGLAETDSETGGGHPAVAARGAPAHRVRSRTTTLAPCWAASRAADRPVKPAPTTAMSARSGTGLRR